MYIAPDTNLIFIKNCPLASNLEHTILFESAGAQQAYFAGLSSQTVDRYSFQRATIGVVRVGISWNDCIGFNYMAFQNHAHGDKWFYAFITNYEYVNEGMTAVFFQIDVLQTYMFDWVLGSCLVERETTPTDEPGDYLLPEPIYVGETKPVASTSWRSIIDWIVGATFDITQDGFPDLTSPVQYTAGQLREYQVYGCSRGGLGWAGKLSQVVTAGKTNGIRWVFPYPRDLILKGSDTDTYYVASENIITKTISGRPTKLGEYEPKNKKLLTYPYCYLCAVTTDGKVGQYRYEYFTNPDSIKFQIYGALSPQSSIAAAPYDYWNSNKPVNYDVQTVLGGLPIGGFNYDVYSTWFALNKNTINSNMFWSALNAVRGGGSAVAEYGAGVQEIEQNYRELRSAGEVASYAAGADALRNAALGSAGAGLALQVASVGLSLAETFQRKYAKEADMQAMPNEVALQAGTGDLQLAQIDYGIDFNTMCILPQFAKVADDYFSRFGYKVMETKTPTLNNRPVWDFIKTLDTDIGGNVPAVALQEIRSAFSRGVTFWHNAATFGDYSQDNTV